ncbi:MAG: MarR family winged helix-turn-helix transcriptional regulator [Candidatus Izemoplasmatales bacterium]|uniref:MarR family transcriptional regulator n=1 Tax=Hujiaoplasma nucleasis TaxID=2725268 RepID=A0A7L6N2Z9_9MOLU|nr:MarR family transcriptional regulator [Hujiaoplasma nucleasis]QLY39435.1 MarR family transcriptional regulator [Hujiaoplasma nucleasis]
MNNQHERMINKYHHKFLEEKFKEFNLGRAEAPYIKMIYHQSPIKMNTLISNVVFHKSHTTRAINQMVKDGLITKEKDLEDKRSYIITITQKGIKVAEQVKQILEEWENLIDSALNEEERNQLNIMREKVYYKLKEHFEEDLQDEKNV